MKTATLTLATLALIWTAATAAQAQGPGGGPPPGSPPSAADLIAEFDADGDGSLNAAELTESFEAMRPPAPPQSADEGERPEPPLAEDMAVDWIDQFDADQNAELSVAELTAAFQTRHPHGPPPPDSVE